MVHNEAAPGGVTASPIGRVGDVCLAGLVLVKREVARRGLAKWLLAEMS